MFDLCREDGFCSIDEGKGGLTGRLGGGGTYRPQDGLKLVDPVLPAGFEFLVESLHFQSLEYLGVGTLGLAIASGVSYGGIADLGANAGAVSLEGAAGELAAIVSDDPVGHTEAASDPLDEFNGGPYRDGPHGLHLWPFRKFVDDDI